MRIKVSLLFFTILTSTDPALSADFGQLCASGYIVGIAGPYTGGGGGANNEFGIYIDPSPQFSASSVYYFLKSATMPITTNASGRALLAQAQLAFSTGARVVIYADAGYCNSWGFTTIEIRK